MSLVVNQTVKDLLSPTHGWKSIARDLFTVTPQLIGKRGKKLGISDLFDVDLLLGTPVSFARNLLTIFMRLPIPTTVLLMVIVALQHANDVAASVLPGVQQALPEGTGGPPLLLSSDFLGTLSTDLLIAAFAAYMLTALVLVRASVVVLLLERDAILANSIRECCKRADSSQTVVAILGMAHCNGVAKLLKDGETHKKLAKRILETE